MKTDRYFFAQDNDCIWYVVEADRREEWEAWTELTADDDRHWVVPDFARQLNHHLSSYTFTDLEMP